MRWRRKPKPEQIRAWLDTGAPEWVEQWIDHPDVTSELERLTELPAGDADRLAGVFEPAAGFEERTVHGVSERVSDLERIGVLFDLLGLGPRTARAMVDPRAFPEDS